MSDIGLVILAAGASTRMGTPKQLLPYRGQTLIEYIVEQAIASICDPIIVVLGANAEHIQPKLTSFNIQTIKNCSFAEGMSNSIRTGIEVLTAENSYLKGVVLMVCDQPFVSTQLINQLVENYRKDNSLIVASEYNGVLGVPCLFERTLFSHLMALSGDAGARKLIKGFAQDTIGVPAPEVAFDLDTPADYEQLHNLTI
ncbi:MAG TPA: nucleotidyltransferase family protein [Oculatellaceae cyanobacterium]|jgi:molybdenum cofactor cytidylyltransferase